MDDNEGGCCHWSKHVQAIFNDIEQDERIVEYRMSKLNFEDGTKPHSIIKTIMEDAFIEACIDATNEHVHLIQNMRKRLGRFQKMKKAYISSSPPLCIEAHCACTVCYFLIGDRFRSHDPTAATTLCKRPRPYSTSIFLSACVHPL